MKENIDQVVYSSCAFLEKTMETDDELEVIILVKKIKKITTREI